MTAKNMMRGIMLLGALLAIIIALAIFKPWTLGQQQATNTPEETCKAIPTAECPSSCEVCASCALCENLGCHSLDFCKDLK